MVAMTFRANHLAPPVLRHIITIANAIVEIDVYVMSMRTIGRYGVVMFGETMSMAHAASRNWKASSSPHHEFIP